MNMYRTIRLAALFLTGCSALNAQGNYEIQVYGSDTVPAGRTMVELHSNFTIEGSTNSPSSSPTVVEPTNAVTLPTNHQLHETVEITQGWNSWFETGFYIFTSAGPNQGYKWVGDHIRPRVRVPDSWHWPLGVSLSTEVGYQRPIFSRDTWTWEIRPIIDKQLGRWYLAFNPALERSWHGPSVGQGVAFSPNFQVSYNVTKKVQASLEYYGDLGDITGFDPLYEQQQQIVPAINYDFGPDWEFNFGVGVGATRTTDHLLIKAIVGRRFRFITPRASDLAQWIVR
ncbi:MAG: transporter [Acidobacteriota bacterium]|nr:transporter [Acidobacteriota bacterium]